MFVSFKGSQKPEGLVGVSRLFSDGSPDEMSVRANISVCRTIEQSLLLLA